MKEFEVKFIKNGKEVDTFIIDADNIEEAKTTAEDLAHEDGTWAYDLEIKVAEEFLKMGERVPGSKKKNSVTKASDATKFFASYKDALASVGYPNAEKYSYGIGGGWREYTFVDCDNMKGINLAYKKETGYKVTGVHDLYNKPTASLTGFTLPEEKERKWRDW